MQKEWENNKPKRAFVKTALRTILPKTLTKQNHEMGPHFDLRFRKTQMQLVSSYLMESLSILKHSILHYDPTFLFINEFLWPNLLSPGRISQIQKFMKKGKV